MPADMPAHEVAVDHLIPSERPAKMPDRPPARLMSLSTAALLRRTLNAHRHGWVLESRLRRLARMVSEDARRSGLAAEQMLVAFKEEWDALPESRQIRDGKACADLRSRIITLCIGEFYARRRASNPSAGGTWP